MPTTHPWRVLFEQSDGLLQEVAKYRSRHEADSYANHVRQRVKGNVKVMWSAEEAPPTDGRVA